MKILELLEKVELNSKYEGEDIVADMYYKYRLISLDKPIVITFPPNGKGNNKDSKIPPYGFNFLCQYDVNIISFGVLGLHDDNYFLNSEFSLFIEKLGLLLYKFKIRLGLGNSKGAFGIGAYAVRLKLDSAMLFYPISTKKLELVSWDTRPSTKAVQHLDWSGQYSDLNLGDCKGYVIYDPSLKIDEKHAKRFENFTHIKIHGFGHGVGYAFLAGNSKVIHSLVEKYLYEQKVDVLKFKQEAKILRLSKDYYKQLLNQRPDNKILLRKQEQLRKVSATNLDIDVFSFNEINAIRDAAIILESTDLKQSLVLMKIAQKMRPGVNDGVRS